MTNPLAVVADRIADVVVEEGARVRAELAAGLSKTVDAARVAGAIAVPLSNLPPSGRARTARGRLAGWSLRETGGTVGAVVNVYGGADSSDATKLLATIAIDAGKDKQQPPATPGVFFAEGVTVTITGAVAGVLYFAGTD